MGTEDTRSCVNCSSPLGPRDSYCGECGYQAAGANSGTQGPGTIHSGADEARRGAEAVSPDTAHSEMVRCRDCGGTVSVSATKCPHCGTPQQVRSPTRDPAIEQPRPVPESKTTTLDSAPAKRNIVNPPFAIIAGIGAVALIFLILVVVMNAQTSETSTGDPAATELTADEQRQWRVLDDVDLVNSFSCASMTPQEIWDGAMGLSPSWPEANGIDYEVFEEWAVQRCAEELQGP